MMEGIKNKHTQKAVQFLVVIRARKKNKVVLRDEE